MIIGNKKTTIVQFQTVITTLRNGYAGRSFSFGGKVWKTNDLVGAFQAAIDALNAANADKIAWQAGVAKAKTAKQLAETLYAALKGYIGVADGKKSQAYKTFGFAPQPSGPTPATKVAAADKTRATRKAFVTRGKRQKQAIKVALAAAPAAGNSSNGAGGSGGNGVAH